MPHGKIGHTIDALMLGAIPLGALAQILPPMAAAVSIIYGIIKIIESDTFKSLIKRFSKKD